MRVLAFLLAASPAMADPMFEDLSATLPDHRYTGGWEHYVGGGVAVFDCDGDQRPDLFAAGGEAPARLFRNLGGMAFVDADLPNLTGVTGAYPLDIDGDAVLDLFVLRVGPNVVLRGAGGCQFEDATTDWGIDPGNAWSTAFSAWWAPGDDRPTLAVGNYVDRDDPAGPFGTCDTHQILTPGSEGYQSASLGPGFCTLSMLAASDARGRPTLRISNDRHYHADEGYEQMYDLAEARFLTAADGWGELKIWGMGIASRDLTGDGLDEVMLTSMGDQLLQIATEDGYAQAPFSKGVAAHRPFTGDDTRPSTGWHAAFGDIDNDTRADLFISKGNVEDMEMAAAADPNNLLLQGADGTFVETADSAGVASMEKSRGAALADLDGDGRLDLVVVNRSAPMELYRNVTEAAGNWIAVQATAPAGNRFGVGTRITVSTDTGEQTQEITVGGGHAGGAALPLHFGLGSATEAMVSATRPDGQVIRFGTVATGQVVSVDLGG